MSRAVKGLVVVAALAALAAVERARAEDTPDRHRDRSDDLGDPLPDQAIARLGTSRFWACGKLAFSPDGKVLACSTPEGTRVFEVPSGRAVQRVRTPSADDLALLEDGTLVARWASSARAWRLGKGDLATSDIGPEGASACALSPDGSASAGVSLAAPGKRCLRVVGTRDGKELARVESEDDVFDQVVLSRDAGLLAAARSDGSIAIHDLRRRSVIAKLVEPDATLVPARFSPDAKLLAVTGKGTILLWDVASASERARIPACADPVAFSRDGRLLAYCEREGQGRVVIWDIALEKPRLALALGEVRSLAFSPVEDVLAVSRTPPSIVLVDAASGNEVAPLPGHRSPVTSLAFLADGKRLVSSESRLSIVWDLDGRRELGRIPLPPGPAPAVTPDGKSLLAADTSSRKATISWIDLETGAVRRTLDKVRAHVMSLAVSPDGKVVAVGASDGTARLVDPGTGRETEIVDPDFPQREVRKLAFSPDGKALALGQREVTSLWERGGSEPPAHLETETDGGGSTLRFSSDGTLLASLRSSGALVWDAKTRKKVGTVHLGWFGATDLVFLPGGTELVMGASDGAIRVFEATTGAALRKLDGQEDHRAAVSALAVSPDGKMLASGSVDGTILLWDVSR